MKKTRLYLSGPMTGLPDYNFPAFHTAAAALRAQGCYEVVNPAEINDASTAYEAALRADIRELTTCDWLVLLPGWKSSKGAHLELHLAHRLGLAIYDLAELV